MARQNVIAMQKVFTVLTRSVHKKTDFRKVKGFKITNVEISHILAGLGIKDEATMAIFDPSDDSILYTITLNENFMMGLEQNGGFIEPTNKISDILHVVMELVRRIDQEISSFPED